MTRVFFLVAFFIGGILYSLLVVAALCIIMQLAVILSRLLAVKVNQWLFGHMRYVL